MTITSTTQTSDDSLFIILLSFTLMFKLLIGILAQNLRSFR